MGTTFIKTTVISLSIKIEEAEIKNCGTEHLGNLNFPIFEELFSFHYHRKFFNTFTWSVSKLQRSDVSDAKCN